MISGSIVLLPGLSKRIVTFLIVNLSITFEFLISFIVSSMRLLSIGRLSFRLSTYPWVLLVKMAFISEHFIFLELWLEWWLHSLGTSLPSIWWLNIWSFSCISFTLIIAYHSPLNLHRPYIVMVLISVLWPIPSLAWWWLFATLSSLLKGVVLEHFIIHLLLHTEWFVYFALVIHLSILY